MSRPTASALDHEGIEAFLEGQTTGTLSFAKDDDSYAIPVAFTFAPESRDFYFRLGYAPGSTKREFLDATDRATFVVAADTDEGWKSVVARGPVEHRSTVEDLDAGPSVEDAVSQARRELEIPFYDVFESPDDVTFTLVRLRSEELTGVVEAGED